MCRRLMGVESEYAFTAVDMDGDRLSRSVWVSKLMSLAKENLEVLDGDGAPFNLFLGNGSRFYMDQSHPELSTPECTNPYDVVRYVKAGDRLLHGLATQLEREVSGVSEALLFRGNVCYAGTFSTWGCHESYMHMSDPALLGEQIIPHLVSRIIYAGAGGFDSTSPGLQFTLSARAPHIVKTVSYASTGDRGIYHTKDEPLGRGYHRLHLLCGDSLFSESALWLTVGSTALVVRMAEHGVKLGERMRLMMPLRALRTFARHPDCKATVRLMRGARATAIDIQRYYLEQAEARAGERYMPEWAGEVCRVWRETLDGLEQDPAGLQGKLDWATKLALYKEHARRRGIDWEQLTAWRTILEEVQNSMIRIGHPLQFVSMDDINGGDGTIRARIEALAPRLKRKKLSLDDLERVIELRGELFEIDTRFAQVGEKGIFESLDRAGALSHKLLRADEIMKATKIAPTEGRAHLRGQVIRRLAGGKERCTCSWNVIWNMTANRRLILADPFGTEERWEEYAVPKRHLRRRLPMQLELLRRSRQLEDPL